MANKTIYLFLDWVNTCNELLDNYKLNKKRVNDFISVLKELEKTFRANIKLIIITGSAKETAKYILENLLFAFKDFECEDMIAGVGYEYGGYILNNDFNSLNALNFPLSQNNLIKLKKILRKYNFKLDKRYKLYSSVKLDKISENEKNFINECFEQLSDVEYEIYNDKFGCGIDIKNPNLTKRNFVQFYMSNVNDARLVIMSGDSLEDMNMLKVNLNCEKYFISLLNERIDESNIIDVDKSNIQGVIKGLKNILKLKGTHL